MEKCIFGDAWAAYEKAKAKERQQENARRNQPQNVENFPPIENTSKSRDAIGARVGVSGRTYHLRATITAYVLAVIFGNRLSDKLSE